MEDPSGNWPRWVNCIAATVLMVAVVAAVIFFLPEKAIASVGAAVVAVARVIRNVAPKITQSAKTSTASQRIANARMLGQQGEKAANIVKNTERIASASKTAKYRIPDGLDHIDKVLTEVKNVKYQGLTNQLKDFSIYASNKGYDFTLKTRQNTIISGPLQKYIDDGRIIHLFLGK